MAANTPVRLTADDWSQAAFDAFVEGGLDAVAVEPVAQRLGATKGSFYWHFANRAALVEAVLGSWHSRTEEIIGRLAELPDPRQRLLRLFEVVYADNDWARTETDLLSRTRDPLVARAVEHTTRRRLDFMTGCLGDLGVDEQSAADGALQAYALWIGLLQLLATVPGVVGGRQDGERFFASTLSLLETLLPIPPGDARSERLRSRGTGGGRSSAQLPEDLA